MAALVIVIVSGVCAMFDRPGSERDQSKSESAVVFGPVHFAVGEPAEEYQFPHNCVAGRRANGIGIEILPYSKRPNDIKMVGEPIIRARGKISHFLNFEDAFRNHCWHSANVFPFQTYRPIVVPNTWRVSPCDGHDIAEYPWSLIVDKRSFRDIGGTCACTEAQGQERGLRDEQDRLEHEQASLSPSHFDKLASVSGELPVGFFLGTIAVGSLVILAGSLILAYGSIVFGFLVMACGGVLLFGDIYWWASAYIGK